MNYEIIYLILLMLLSGAFAGFVAGLFGIGGGIILMPALMYGFDQLGYSVCLQPIYPLGHRWQSLHLQLHIQRGPTTNMVQETSTL